MVLKQTVLISSTSTVLLVLVTGVIVYFYSNYARPEALHPKMLKDDFKKRERSVMAVVKSIKTKFPDNLKINAVVEDFKDVLKDLGPQTALKDNEIKSLFKNILSSDIKNHKVSEYREIRSITPIIFPPILITEIPETEIPKSFKRSEEVFIGQVGLSLFADNFFAAVYRIQNLFGKAGLVGHFFVMKSNHRLDPFSKYITGKVDFSTKDNFKKYFKGQKVNEFGSQSNDKTSYILVNEKFVNIETFKSVLEPDFHEANGTIINPYKWLHLSTKLKSKFPKTENEIYALTFPEDEKENQEGIIYPSDVRVFEFDWMEGADFSLYSGCIKRIENHCRDYLKNEEIPL